MTLTSVLLDTPSSVAARLGWDPGTSVHDRRRILAKELIAARLGCDMTEIRIEREAPRGFGYHTRLIASRDGQELPIAIVTASYRAATVVAICDPGLPLGIDIRDMTPEQADIRLMQKHSHLFDPNNIPDLLQHWVRVQAVLEADGRVFHNAGATEAQELGIMLASAVAHLRLFEEARQALVYAAPHIGFALSVDQNQFLSIAKIRALRALWARIQQASSIPASPAIIHAETSFRMMAAKDPETNILRTTIACFAAAAGGADSISILPHTITHGLPAGFARRIARNTQLIMTRESHIEHVNDPARGSGSVEALTEGLCETAWAEFQHIETEGGILDSLRDGHIQARVLTSQAMRAEKLRHGERTIIGSTLYPPKAERPVETLAAERRPEPTDGIVFCQALHAMRDDQTTEAAR